ncbi:glycosyltransferase [Maridesulfovibrio sp.]|uniref:glycosyltransferase family 2 protein n=1 Tax=Maridesulfovibrio sp. TaxID=2795000 RepID=UPI0029F4EA14|nr:glycosyltransferase [Maridesulfovibrio sp.]
MTDKVQAASCNLPSFLAKRLIKNNFLGRQFAYGQLGPEIAHSPLAAKPSASLIVVLNDPDPDLYNALKSIVKYREPVELVLVHNNSRPPAEEPLLELAHTKIVLQKTTSEHCARNIGALCANSPLLIFISDKVIPEAQLVKVYVNHFSTNKFLAARGKVMGQDDFSEPYFGHLAGSNTRHSWALDLDENMAITAEAYFEVGGFDESLPEGYVALNMSIQLLTKWYDKKLQSHLPTARCHLGKTFDLELRQVVRQKAFKTMLLKYPTIPEYLHDWCSNMEEESRISSGEKND